MRVRDLPPYRNVHNGHCGWWMLFRFEAARIEGAMTLQIPQ
jgi:hypothetical protein